MADPEITNVDLGSIELEGASFGQDELLTVGGAVTILAGTILARDTSTLKLVPYVKGGVTAGNGIPRSVISYPITSAGAGDLPVRVITHGRIKQERLIIDADGNDTNVDNIVLDELRLYGITPIPVEQLGELDNQ